LSRSIGWAHFTQNAEDLEDSFKTLGIISRSLLVEPGVPHADHGFLKSAPSTCVKLLSHFGAEWKGGICGPQKN
jgi:L-arabinose isomerase